MSALGNWKDVILHFLFSVNLLIAALAKANERNSITTASTKLAVGSTFGLLHIGHHLAR